VRSLVVLRTGPRQGAEDELGGIVAFLEGASGSTHNLALSGDEMTTAQIAVKDAVAKAQPRSVSRLAAIKRPFKFKVRTFEETKEDESRDALLSKIRRHLRRDSDSGLRDMRKTLASQQGQERETWLQALLIGDVAIVRRAGGVLYEAGSGH